MHPPATSKISRSGQRRFYKFISTLLSELLGDGRRRYLSVRRIVEVEIVRDLLHGTSHELSLIESL
jgi:hypothetical protein